MKTKRNMIQVDEERCDGCGLCVPACPEGALRIIDGKARVVRESYCDGLGACLGNCPNDALHVLQVEADAYDEAGVIAHLRQAAPDTLARHMAHLQGQAPRLAGRPVAVALPARPPAPDRSSGPDAVVGCPSAQIHFWEPQEGGASAPVRVRSELRQWPVQLHLLPPHAPFFQDANLTLIADCVPFAYPDLHADFVKDSAIAIGCPKLDDAGAYVEKMTQILQANDIRSLKVVYMEVPCCRGLVWIAEQALARSGAEIALSTQVISISN